jgi:hypothetical protein
MNELALNVREIEKVVQNVVAPLVGDTPVSVQIMDAIVDMAYNSDVLALRQEVARLREEVKELVKLVGDTPVSVQINMAMYKPEN